MGKRDFYDSDRKNREQLYEDFCLCESLSAFH